MEANKILQSDMLDILFENRNQQYGAYELRRNYSRRTIKALTISFSSVALLIALSSFDKPKEKEVAIKDAHEVIARRIDEQKPATPAQPVVHKAAALTRTIKNNEVVIVPNEQVTEPVASIEDLSTATVGAENVEGPAYEGNAVTEAVGEATTKGIVAEKEFKEEIASVVDVKAKYLGDWIKFLTRNLDANVGVENGAPAGQYRVIVEFVIDVDGSMSMIRPLTNLGYGMEQEAVRVIKKANKWTPALQRSFPVKAYHRQIITFDITGD